MEYAVALEQFPYLSGQSPEFAASANCYVGFNGHRFLAHSQLLGHKSPHLAIFFSLSAPLAASCGELPTIPLHPLAWPLPLGLASITRAQFEMFLRHFYEPGATTDRVRASTA